MSKCKRLKVGEVESAPNNANLEALKDFLRADGVLVETRDDGKSQFIENVWVVGKEVYVEVEDIDNGIISKIRREK